MLQCGQNFDFCFEQCWRICGSKRNNKEWKKVACYLLSVFANGIVGGEISRLYYMIIAVNFDGTTVDYR